MYLDFKVHSMQTCGETILAHIVLLGITLICNLLLISNHENIHLRDYFMLNTLKRPNLERMLLK